MRRVATACPALRHVSFTANLTPDADTGLGEWTLRNFMDNAGSGLGGMLSLFTGGAIKRMGIFALGVMPYISASIIVQLLASMIPALEQLKKEGDQGRKKINQYTRYATVGLAAFQGWAIAASIVAGGLASDPSLFFKLSCVVTLVGGTMFLMWLGEQITARGIGNGVSLIIFTGIVAEIPAALAKFLSQGRTGGDVAAGDHRRNDRCGGRDCLCGVHGTRPAQDPYPISPPSGRHEDL